MIDDFLAIAIEFTDWPETLQYRRSLKQDCQKTNPCIVLGQVKPSAKTLRGVASGNRLANEEGCVRQWPDLRK
jgi:hypothetical protein